ncbi:hypothetical protein [Nakamurella aerolata]|uniref:Uncharacterized protein n=1 Tax=Nakamurella aerolata TaxID=1656892 RepID=A0A849AKN7_9ACTN|nr:hypothetical protein [Nakamurella aerolata]NNG37382.1 hypothetical protein [Nakamurella aerolata]
MAGVANPSASAARWRSLGLLACATLLAVLLLGAVTVPFIAWPDTIARAGKPTIVVLLLVFAVLPAVVLVMLRRGRSDARAVLLLLGVVAALFGIQVFARMIIGGHPVAAVASGVGLLAGVGCVVAAVGLIKARGRDELEELRAQAAARRAARQAGTGGSGRGANAGVGGTDASARTGGDPDPGGVNAGDPDPGGVNAGDTSAGGANAGDTSAGGANAGDTSAGGGEPSANGERPPGT